MTIPSPYKGLDTYTAADRERFFGRDDDRRILIAKVFSARVTLFFGVTGAGKSSLLLAGVIPELTDPQGHRLNVSYHARWNPHEDPRISLKRSIKKTLQEAGILAPEEPVSQQGATLRDFVGHYELFASDPFVIVIDQFEEFFLYHAGKPEFSAFIRELSELINDRELSLAFIVAMREDFLAELDVFWDKAPNFSRNRYRLEKLSREKAEEAIVKPLPPGFSYEKGLVERLLDDLSGQQQFCLNKYAPNADSARASTRIEAPYLQIVCQALWQVEQRRGEKLLRLTTYEQRLGGARKIVRNHVKRAMKVLTFQEQMLAFEMFRYLVTSRGTKMAYRDEDLADSQLLDVPVEDIRPILEHLAGRETRILRSDNRSDGVWYELYHDIFAEIIRDWVQTFQEDENRQIYMRLVTAARKWRSEGREEGALLRGGRLTQAEQWSKEHLDVLNAEQKTFLELSLKKHYRSVWRRRGVVTAIAIFAIIASLLGWYANKQKNTVKEQQEHTAKLLKEAEKQSKRLEIAFKEAEEARVEAEEQRENAEMAKGLVKRHAERVSIMQLESQALLATYYPGTRDGSPEQGLLLAAQALALNEPPQSLQSLPTLQRIIEERVPLYKEEGLVNPGQSISLNDGTLELIRDENGDVKIAGSDWRPRGHQEPVLSVAFNQNGTQLVSGGGDRNLILWDAATVHTVKLPWQGHLAAVRSVAFSPDGKHIVSGSDDKTLILWNAQEGKPSKNPWEGHQAAVRSVAFSPDGNRIISGSDDNTLILWNALNGEPLGSPWQGHTEGVRSVAFSPDGGRIISGSDDSTLILWDVASRSPIGNPWKGHKGAVSSVAFNSEGDKIISGSNDATLILWDASTGKPVGTAWKKHRTAVRSVAFRPDGKRVVSGSDDGTVILWTIQGEAVNTPWKGHTGKIHQVAFSPDGKQIVSASDDKTLIVWDPNTGKEIHRGYSRPSMALSSNEKLAISAGEDNALVLRDLQNNQLIGKPWKGHRAAVASAAFSQDGNSVVSVDVEGRILRWPVPPKGWIDLVCQTLERGFTPSEWRKFNITQNYEAKSICQEKWEGRKMSSIAIGIDEMKNPDWNLRGCVNDALIVEELLQTLGRSNPKKAHFIRNQEATLMNLTDILKNQLPIQAGAGETVVIYYSGHGSQVRDLDGDEPDGMDEILIPHDLDWDHPLTDDMLREWWKDVEANIVLILDSVNSGGFADDFDAPEFGHVTILAACQAEQEAHEKYVEGTVHGAFSYFLAQGLQGDADLDHDLRITVSEIFEYTRRQLEKSPFPQIPVLKEGRENAVLSTIKKEFLPPLAFNLKDVLGLSQRMIKSSNINAAELLFRQIIEYKPAHTPDLIEGIIELGREFAEAGKSEHAWTTLQLLTKLNVESEFIPTENISKWQAKGLIEEAPKLSLQGKNKEAVRNYEQALLLDPALEETAAAGYAQALNRLAWTLIHEGNELDKGVAYAKKSLHINPEQDPTLAIDTLALGYIKQGHYDEALSLLDEALKKTSDEERRQILEERSQEAREGLENIGVKE